MKKGLIASLRVGLAAFVMLFATNLLPLAAASALTDGPPPAEPRFTICHATASVSHPYDEITVPQSAVDGVAGSSVNGQPDHYSEHNDPLFNPLTTHQGDKWGDIIPAVPSYHSGLNLSVAGLAILANHCDIPTPAPTGTPIFTVLTCDANGSYTIPTTEGVRYLVDHSIVAAGTHTVPAAGTVTVTAEPLPGFTLTGLDSWTFTFTAPTGCTTPTRVTAGVVTFNDGCGIENDSYTIPNTPNVTYKIGTSVLSAGEHSATGTVTIIAYAVDPGYVLTAPYTFTHDFTNVPCVTPPTPVPTVAPTSANLTCNNDGSYTIPTTVGVRYLVDNSIVAAGPHTVAAAGTVTVTAEALTGFTLTGPASWTFTFTTPTDCTTPGLGGGDTNGTVLGILTVAPVVTAPKAPAPQPELVNTGQNSIVDMIVGLAIAGIALTTAGLARRRQTT